MFIAPSVSLSKLRGKKVQIRINKKEMTEGKSKISLFSAELKKCNSNTCPGNCTSKNVCECPSGYVNYPRDKDNLCSYKQKKQLTAFLLELFLPFGVGHLYIGRVFFGITKMIIVTAPVTICTFTFLGILISDKFLSGGNSSMLTVGSVLIFLIVGGIWFISDAAMFILNRYPDGHGIPLKPW